MAAIIHPAASRASEQGASPGSMRCRVTEARSGQSVVEFALIAPIIVIVLLGLLNLGLAIRAHLQIAQEAQEAAQYLVYHPGVPYNDPTNPPCQGPVTTVTSGTCVANYIDNVLQSNYPVTAQRDTTASGDQSQVTVTVGTSSLPTGTACTLPNVNTCPVQQDTVKIDYYFRVIFPLVGSISLGPFQPGGFLNLGATASTVAASHSVGGDRVLACTIWVDSSNTYHGCPDLAGSAATLGQHELLWIPPQEASAPSAGISLPLAYCMYGIYLAADTTQHEVFLKCQPGSTSSAKDPSGNPYLYYIDTTVYNNQGPPPPPPGVVNPVANVDYTKPPSLTGANVIFYAIAAQQSNGILQSNGISSSWSYSVICQTLPATPC